MVFSRNYFVNTTDKVDVINIVHDVRRAIQESGILNGVAVVIPPGPHAAVTSFEYDLKTAKLISDFLGQLVVDSGVRVGENKRELRPDWQLRAMLIGRSFSIPVVNGGLMLEPRQDIVLIDFEDTGRRREFRVQVVGDGKEEGAVCPKAGPAGKAQKGIPLGKIAKKV